MKDLKRLVVVPSDPLAEYGEKGCGGLLERYYNPRKIFQEVFVVSPLETSSYEAHGMKVLGIKEGEFGQVLRRIGPDIVRAYGGYWPADLVTSHRVKGIPVIVSVHDSLPESVHGSLRFADLVICVSRAVARQVIAVGVESERICMLTNRMDPGTFRPLRGHPSIPAIEKKFPPGKHILHVGRKSPQKNLDTLIGALRHLPLDYSAVFIGCGDKSGYVALSQEIGVDRRCFWVDSVANQELPLWYSWCDCMCTPSRWEGYGIVFIEAAACGARIVTSDIAPMNEYLTHGVSASLVKDYENPEALAAEIRKACEEPDYGRALSLGAIQASRPFDISIVDAKEVEIYRKAADLPPIPVAMRLRLSAWKLRNKASRSIHRFRDAAAKFNLVF